MNKTQIITIGVFDGVHKGHQRIIKELLKIARRKKEKSSVLTFDPHPLKVLNPQLGPPLLISLEHRLRLLFSLGIDKVFVIKFTKKFSRMSAKDFVKKVLVKQFQVKEVVIGEDFVFGKDQEGNCRFLKNFGKRFNFKVTCIKEVNIGGLPVSSTKIRGLIEKGNLYLAKKLLGRGVTVLGTVIKGRALGRRIGFPTANIDPHHEVIPPSGVYAVRAFSLSKKNFLNADVRGLHTDSRGFTHRNIRVHPRANPRKSALKKSFFNGVLNIGFRPTIGRQKEPTIELHLFNFRGRLYGKEIEVEFVKKIREEKVFETIQELRKEINKDIEKAKEILA